MLKTGDRIIKSLSLTGRLRELIEARSGVDAAIRTAAGELIEARRCLGETAARLPEPGADPQAAQERGRSMAALAISVEQTRSADHYVRHRLADRARAAAVEALADRLTALRPWQGTADDLGGLPCPSPDRMQRWKAARGEAGAWSICVMRIPMLRPREQGSGQSWRS